MALNKKGVYFSLMSLLFIFLFIFLLAQSNYTNYSKDSKNTERRIDSINDFLDNVNRDIGRGLYISSYRSLLAMEQHIVNTGDFIYSPNTYFNEALMNGTIGQSNYTIMKESTFPAWIEKIKQKGSGLNVIVNIDIQSVDLHQNSPWTVSVTADYNVRIDDVNQLVSWDLNKTIEIDLDILGLEDPLYIVKSYGRMTNIIAKSPYGGNFISYSNGTYNNTLFLEQAYNSYYVNNQDAPSFLQRFSNNMSSDVNGIESLVDLRDVFERSLPINDESSIVDYHYWNAASNGDYRVNGTPNWVKIDDTHVSLYNLSGIIYPS